MPPKKRCVHKNRKGELLFTEPPQNGPVYHYGSPLRSADNPRCVPTKRINQSDASWMIPQFDSVTSKDFQRWRHKAQNLQNKDASHAFPQVTRRHLRPRTCKFVPLVFENVRTSYCAVGASGCPSNCCGQTGSFEEPCHNQPNGTSAVASIRPTTSSGACMENVCHSPMPQYADPVAFSPPDICTPDLLSISVCNGCLPQMDSFTPGPCSRFVSGDTSSDGGAASVLVKDTPEHEYGVKVTWRRRFLLMKYLREKGVLSTSDILVKT
ncbi:RAD9, HUS1, RAD1-interacting nuclear orphan protein 1 [Hemicordylus capensis]|uniref:RAD9, HUS1, RAD1-interacting nuclear orphan protein 1 n=1 Tax=Hemicordylus capensis TaxID=884348 RepID=UPI002303C0F3|nr:RAD9, HUS1, RAD1-interacting nuclear orphan protein 1 [Hemicordylus capensis]XP_053112614.1 RAD9, HUS1, RAD1-interacting nuclear orphan protein 1 [Hemicordylus capensis]XP_053112615.1 RAD9, HUS1, RAD1-interacting nuclear orphan protein 1 [Hemicordylus capensis]XP_053112616.1 RAD9, HUS1, RAD1-interacting nuclear orphan protein 1 [Hemicordylus capensis]